MNRQQPDKSNVLNKIGMSFLVDENAGAPNILDTSTEHHFHFGIYVKAHQ